MGKLKLIMMALMMCFGLNSFGTTNDSVYLVKETDAMSGKTYIYGNRSFIVANDDLKIGFKVGTYIKDSDLSFGMITVTMVGIGNCNENDEIIILFENGEKITKKSWREFNCDGKAYFDMNKKEMQLLRTQTLSKIRMTNGRTYDSYTGDVKEEDKRYFIQLFYALDNIQKLQNTKKVDPDAPLSSDWFNMGYSYYKAKDFANAINAFGKVVLLGGHKIWVGNRPYASMRFYQSRLENFRPSRLTIKRGLDRYYEWRKI